MPYRVEPDVFLMVGLGLRVRTEDNRGEVSLHDIM